MAVVVKYIVVRNGIEKMTFATKKEADAYDKQLDIAENLQGFLAGAAEGIEDTQLEALAFFMAEHSAEITTLLKGGNPAKLKSPAKGGGKTPEKAQERPASDKAKSKASA